MLTAFQGLAYFIADWAFCVLFAIMIIVLVDIIEYITFTANIL